MACAFFDRTGAYLDRELPEAERKAYEAHLSTCDECSRELRDCSRLSRFLSAAGMPDIGRQPVSWKAELNRQRMVRFAEMLMAAAAVVMAVCGLWLFRLAGRPDSSAAVAGWERMAVTQQSEATPPAETDDPLAQALLRGQP